MASETLLEKAKSDAKRYKDGLAHKKQMGFLDDWPEFERFKAGKQWPPPTARTKNMPRPVFNIIDYIEGHKVSSVMNEQVKMVFSPQEIPLTDKALADKVSAAADLFTRFADTTWETVKQDELNEEMLEDASNRGTGILHYYWDDSVKGGIELQWIGDLKGEVIDAMNYFPGNPQQRNVQLQPDNIITKRDLVSNVRAEAKKNGISPELIAMITADKDTQDEGYDSAKIELTDSEKVTVVIKYWRNPDTGTIWFRKSASGVVFKDDTDTKMKRYPLAVMQWKRRKKSIFGYGDTEGLIPNQKAINVLLAMQTRSVMLTGWPQLLYKTGAIDPRSVSNEPGAMIEDKSVNAAGFGAQYLNPGPISPLAPALVDKYLEYSKEVSGAQETAMGESSTGQLNATAIMLLQKAAGVPIEGIRRRFYACMEDVGLIWEEFWKTKYVTNRLIKLTDDDGKESYSPFNSADFADIPMHLKIDIGPSSSFSESLMMTSLDKLYDKGAIDTPLYIKYAPQNTMPFKDRLLKDLQERQAAMPPVGPDGPTDPNQPPPGQIPPEALNMPPEQIPQEQMMGGGMVG